MWFYRKIHGLEGVALRYSNVYGPRQNPHGEAGVVALFSRRILNGETLRVFGDGEQTRDYVYVGDIAAANLHVTKLDSPEPETLDDVAFNVATGAETSVLALADSIIAASGRSVDIEHAPSRPGELDRSCLDTGKLRATGWKPEVDLEQGLRRTYDYIANHP
jgi:UDP-glucose 4-epimerase